ncbi:hypothetical protein DIPPA_16467 [Diplonema papillatum]|nr:hypothetical protein DIPPA_16467 [Diplonema papillatum]|eukprot:gene66-111_t
MEPPTTFEELLVFGAAVESVARKAKDVHDLLVATAVQPCAPRSGAGGVGGRQRRQDAPKPRGTVVRITAEAEAPPAYRWVPDPRNAAYHAKRKAALYLRRPAVDAFASVVGPSSARRVADTLRRAAEGNSREPRETEHPGSTLGHSEKPAPKTESEGNSRKPRETEHPGSTFGHAEKPARKTESEGGSRKPRETEPPRRTPAKDTLGHFARLARKSGWAGPRSLPKTLPRTERRLAWFALEAAARVRADNRVPVPSRWATLRAVHRAALLFYRSDGGARAATRFVELLERPDVRRRGPAELVDSSRSSSFSSSTRGGQTKFARAASMPTDSVTEDFRSRSVSSTTASSELRTPRHLNQRPAAGTTTSSVTESRRSTPRTVVQSSIRTQSRDLADSVKSTPRVVDHPPSDVSTLSRTSSGGHHRKDDGSIQEDDDIPSLSVRHPNEPGDSWRRKRAGKQPGCDAPEEAVLRLSRALEGMLKAVPVRPEGGDAGVVRAALAALDRSVLSFEYGDRRAVVEQLRGSVDGLRRALDPSDGTSSSTRGSGGGFGSLSRSDSPTLSASQTNPSLQYSADAEASPPSPQPPGGHAPAAVSAGNLHGLLPIDDGFLGPHEAFAVRSAASADASSGGPSAGYPERSPSLSGSGGAARVRAVALGARATRRRRLEAPWRLAGFQYAYAFEEDRREDWSDGGVDEVGGPQAGFRRDPTHGGWEEGTPWIVSIRTSSDSDASGTRRTRDLRTPAADVLPLAARRSSATVRPLEDAGAPRRGKTVAPDPNAPPQPTRATTRRLKACLTDGHLTAADLRLVKAALRALRKEAGARAKQQHPGPTSETTASPTTPGLQLTPKYPPTPPDRGSPALSSALGQGRGPAKTAGSAFSSSPGKKRGGPSGSGSSDGEPAVPSPSFDMISSFLPQAAAPFTVPADTARPRYEAESAASSTAASPRASVELSGADPPLQTGISPPAAADLLPLTSQPASRTPELEEAPSGVVECGPAADEPTFEEILSAFKAEQGAILEDLRRAYSPPASRRRRRGQAAAGEVASRRGESDGNEHTPPGSYPASGEGTASSSEASRGGGPLVASSPGARDPFDAVERRIFEMVGPSSDGGFASLRDSDSSDGAVEPEALYFTDDSGTTPSSRQASRYRAHHHHPSDGRSQNSADSTHSSESCGSHGEFKPPPIVSQSAFDEGDPIEWGKAMVRMQDVWSAELPSATQLQMMTGSPPTTPEASSESELDDNLARPEDSDSVDDSFDDDDAF